MTRRNTGFPPHVRAIILDRCGGRCEICGEPASDVELHHRRCRGMGSTRRPDTNAASNGLACCASCHRITESFRAAAYEKGHLVRQSQSPLAVPLLWRGQWSLLDDDGFVYRIPAPVGGVAS